MWVAPRIGTLGKRLDDFAIGQKRLSARMQHAKEFFLADRCLGLGRHEDDRGEVIGQMDTIPIALVNE